MLNIFNYIDYREYLEDGEGNPLPCAIMWGSDRLIVVPAKDTIIRNIWASCETWEPTSIKAYESGKVRIDLYPNPANGDVTLIVPESHELLSINIIDITGKVMDVDKSFISSTRTILQTSTLSKGLYFIKVYNSEFSEIKKLIVR